MKFNNIDDLLRDIGAEVGSGTINDNDRFELYINDELLFVGNNRSQLILFIEFILNEKIHQARCDYEIMIDTVRIYVWPWEE